MDNFPYPRYKSVKDMRFNLDASHAEEALEAIRSMAEALYASLGNGPRFDRLKGELKSIIHFQPPELVICLGGPSGVGKTTLVNTLLKARILPTHNASACTSSAIEIRYHPRSDYKATVHFTEYDEWKIRVSNVLGCADLVERRSLVEADFVDIKETFSAVKEVHANILADLNKLRRLTEDEIMAGIKPLLGDTHTLTGSDSSLFLKSISRYVQPGALPDARERRMKLDFNSLAPLVDKIVIHCNANILSKGLVLRDLPGTNDQSAYRNNLGRKFMQDASHAWLVVDAVRATSNSQAKDLLREAMPIAMQKQLVNNDFSAARQSILAFVVSKIDDFDESNIGVELGLARNHFSDYDQAAQHTARKLADLKAKIKSMKATSAQRKRKAVASLSLPAAKAGRGPGSSRTLVQSKNMTADAALETASLHETGSGADDTLEELRDLRDAQKQRADLIKEQKGIRRARFSECARARADFIMPRLKELYSTMIEEVSIKPVCVTTLPPVLCVAAREYEKFNLNEVASDSDEDEDDQDTNSSAFESIEDTGLPDLIALADELTGDGYTRAVIQELFKLRKVANIIQLVVYPANKNPNIANTRAVLRGYLRGYPDGVAGALMHALAGTMTATFAGINAKIGETYCEQLSIRLFPHIRSGAQAAKARALPAYERFSSTRRSAADTTGTLHWQRYLAVLRHDGSYREHDLNELLYSPMRHDVGLHWASSINTDALKHFRPEVQKKLMMFYERLLLSLPEGTRNYFVDAMLDLCEALLQDTSRVLDAATKHMKDSGRAISRRILLDLQDALADGYEMARQERGSGTLSRVKANFANCLRDARTTMFDNAASVAIADLETAATETGSIVQHGLTDVCQQAESALSSIAMEPVDANTAEMKQLRELARDVYRQTGFWTEAGKRDGAIVLDRRKEKGVLLADFALHAA
ncbi:unnamed protein product [Peniophora sp. CBMAI 1063]|nr:unnamed protein product [Peniophora sp. CBMAI 1063]